MVDKFIGDAVMALFGLPISNEFHADMAVKTGIKLKNCRRVDKRVAK